MQHGVLRDRRLELGQLRHGGEVAVVEQIGDLEERRLLCELLDRIPAVPEDAGVTIDVGDGGGACRRVQESMIEGDVTGVLEQRGDIDAALSHGRRNLGERQFAPGVVQYVVAHALLLRRAYPRVMRQSGVTPVRDRAHTVRRSTAESTAGSVAVSATRT